MLNIPSFSTETNALRCSHSECAARMIQNSSYLLDAVRTYGARPGDHPMIHRTQRAHGVTAIRAPSSHRLIIPAGRRLGFSTQLMAHRVCARWDAAMRRKNVQKVARMQLEFVTHLRIISQFLWPSAFPHSNFHHALLRCPLSAATFGYVQPMTGGDVPGVPRKSGSCCSRPAPSQRLSTLLASALVATSTPLPRRWSQP